MKAWQKVDGSLVVVGADVAGCLFWAEKRLDLCAGFEGAGHPADIVAEGCGRLGFMIWRRWHMDERNHQGAHVVRAT
jgi:hypothetical protein